MSELQKYYAKAEDVHAATADCEHMCTAVYYAADIADLKRQHVEELAKMAGDQLARDADMYNLAEENRRLREALQKLAPAAREILWCALCWNDHNHSYADLTAKSKSAAKSLGLIRGEIDQANEWFDSIAKAIEVQS